MLAWAITALIERGWKGWQARLAVIGALVAIAILALGLAVAAIFHHGEKAGATKVEVKAEKAHTKAVTEARIDERKIQTAGAAIAADVGRKTDATTTLVATKKTEIRNAIDSTPRAAAGRDLVPVDSRRLSASLDALIDRANRSADAAGAAP
jgi:hypothetical protein